MTEKICRKCGKKYEYADMHYYYTSEKGECCR